VDEVGKRFRCALEAIDPLAAYCPKHDVAVKAKMKEEGLRVPRKPIPAVLPNCSATVYDGAWPRKCQRSVRVTPEGPAPDGLCAVHSPEANAERSAKEAATREAIAVARRQAERDAAIDRYKISHFDVLLGAAHGVVEDWERGDLAAAVRKLCKVATAAEVDLKEIRNRERI